MKQFRLHLVSLLFALCICVLPLRAAAQTRNSDADALSTPVIVVPARAREPARLRRIESSRAHRRSNRAAIEARETGALLLIAFGSLTTTAVGIGLGVTAAKLDTFDATWPDWASNEIVFETLLMAPSFMALSMGASLLTGGDLTSTLAIVSSLELLVGVLLAIGAAVVACGSDWSNRDAQTNTASLLGLQSLGFGVTGFLGLTYALVGTEGRPVHR